MKYLSEDAVQYMRGVWGFDTAEDVDDMAMFWSEAEYEMVAKRLVDAGAVEPNCKEAKEMIRVAKSISRKEEDEIVDAVLPKYTIIECSACNHVHFIGPYCDAKDWLGKGRCSGCDRAGHTKITRKAVE